MTKLINRRTGSVMRVADDRVDAYLAAGHKLAADRPTVKPIMPEPIVEPGPEKEPEPMEEKKPVKRVRKTIRKR